MFNELTIFIYILALICAFMVVYLLSDERR